MENGDRVFMSGMWEQGGRGLRLLTMCAALALAGARAQAEEAPKPAPKPDAPSKDEPKKPAPKPDDPPPPAPKPKDGEIVDPTQPSEALYKASNPQEKTTVEPHAPPPPPLPEVALKAFVQAQGREPSALIEVNGKSQYMVSEGNEIAVHNSGGQPLTLKVKRMQREGVEIEVVQLKVTIVVK
jgi:hypothetical protein